VMGGLNNPRDPVSHMREAFLRDCLLGGQRGGMKLKFNLREERLQI
jgi:hypothetical protein